MKQRGGYLSSDDKLLFYVLVPISLIIIIGLGFAFAYLAHKANPEVRQEDVLKYYWIVAGVVIVMMALPGLMV
jgi:O-antigen/teichoic acid export membrane protein